MGISHEFDLRDLYLDLRPSLATTASLSGTTRRLHNAALLSAELLQVNGRVEHLRVLGCRFAHASCFEIEIESLLYNIAISPILDQADCFRVRILRFNPRRFRFYKSSDGLSGCMLLLTQLMTAAFVTTVKLIALSDLHDRWRNYRMLFIEEIPCNITVLALHVLQVEFQSLLEIVI